MPSAEETAQTDEPQTDEARSAILEALQTEFGDSIVASHIRPGEDLWVRVKADSWDRVARFMRNRQRYRFFDWLSAIDWMPSPYGRSHGAMVDGDVETGDGVDRFARHSGAEGITGGDTRFQVMARVYDLTSGIGVTLKSDVAEDMTINTWVGVYPGAGWHERETHEMFGINFYGNPDLRNIYLPSEFEGRPLRKDFPLMARLVKPWPGLVDVEPMPEVDDGGEE